MAGLAPAHPIGQAGERKALPFRQRFASTTRIAPLTMSCPYRPAFTLAGIRLGARLALPLLPGAMVFASAFGAAAAQKGLELWQTMAFSATVFAGASQMVALEVWQDPWTLTGLLVVTVLVATVNARMILMGAAIQPYMAGASRGQVAAVTFVLADANWLIGMRYHGEGGRDLGVVLGAGIALWCGWLAATLPGYLAGAVVPDPERFGLDLVMPIFFAAMLVPMWKGFRPAIPWAVAGGAALIAQALIPGYAFIIIGALAGAFAGALIGDA